MYECVYPGKTAGVSEVTGGSTVSGESGQDGRAEGQRRGGQVGGAQDVAGR